MVVSSAPGVLRVGAALLLALALFIALPSAHPTRAATLTVTNLNDSGDGSLRHAIEVAAPGDTITFGVNGTITLTSGELSIGTDLTIDGPGATSLIVNGNSSSRVFFTHHATVVISGVTISDGLIATGDNEGGAGILNAIGTLTLDRVVISNNHVPGPDVNGARVGGGIVNQDQGTLTLSNSTISGNSSDRGGGIFNSGGPSTMTVSDSTISGNTARAGGGIVNYGTLGLSSTTVSNNNSTGGTNNIGGIASEAGRATLKNTIIANNAMGGDCGGTTPISSSGYNLISDASCTFSGPGDLNGQDPKLGPLADNGGPTQTQALLAGSPAVDAGSPDCPPPATDQRGVSRPQGPACDIGAFESQLGISRIWGDGDCSGDIGPRDAQAVLKNVLVQDPLSQTQPCPAVGSQVTVDGVSRIWSDWDCGGDIGPRDAQAILKNVLVQDPLSQTQPCPAVGSTVQVAG